MKKLTLCLAAYLIATVSYKYVFADGIAVQQQAVVDTATNTKLVYNEIDFGKNKLDYTVFAQAYTGYINLLAAGKLNTDKNLLTVCDMSKSSKEYRLWVIDIPSRKVLINDYVAHGQGSGEEYANRFSNRENSHQSSIGFYVTGDTYNGGHGLSLYLHGMDEGFNNAAYQRSIVVHGAPYVSEKFIASEGRLGRSWGCPAVSEKICSKLINTIKDGTCMYIYYPQEKYCNTSCWLKTPGTLPAHPSVLAVAARDTHIVYKLSPDLQKAADEIARMKMPLL